MSNQRNSGNDVTSVAIVGLIVVGIVVYIVIKGFSDAIGVPPAVGGRVLAGLVVTVLLTAGIGWWLSSIRHSRCWLTTLLVFCACLSVALWPALNIWAADLPPGLAMFGYEERFEPELAWWGGHVMRGIALAGFGGGAIVAFFKNDY